MRTINTHQAKTQLSSLIAAVENSDEVVIICRNGKPVAELRRPSQPLPGQRSRLTPDPRLAGKILYDPTEPATEEDWPTEFR
ncbi:MAG: type II toxin-antitoxin system Phd/YefM family antitoxin [Verrucomicrobia bacterium]|jgi:antitoxin (DNA-binding transcriptional repressor) of toxin-antitoxin stability system|nr:MAG: type II toxin-antitoxin system Phd/YefM family antitoxin [Verrucomicrobiota bacterium]